MHQDGYAPSSIGLDRSVYGYDVLRSSLNAVTRKSGSIRSQKAFFSEFGRSQVRAERGQSPPDALVGCQRCGGYTHRAEI